MTLRHGTRIRIKFAVELGLKASAYAFEAQQGAYYFIDEKSKLGNCWSACPEDELDGKRADIRMFNEKKKYHITIPEHCFVVDPVIKYGTVAQRERLVRALQPFGDYTLDDLDDVITLLSISRDWDKEQLVLLLGRAPRK